VKLYLRYAEPLGVTKGVVITCDSYDLLGGWVVFYNDEPGRRNGLASAYPAHAVAYVRRVRE